MSSRASEKVFLKAGESAEISFDLDERAFAYWSEKFDDWHVEAGEYTVEVGTSSRDIAGSVAVVTLDGDGKALPLDRMVQRSCEWAVRIRSAPKCVASAVCGRRGRQSCRSVPDNDMMRMFLKSMPINSMPMLMSEGGKAITAFMLDEYAKIAETAE